MESGQIDGGANLSERGANFAEAAETSSTGSGATPRKVRFDGGEPSAVD
jgi:hypothetical protein